MWRGGSPLFDLVFNSQCAGWIGWSIVIFPCFLGGIWVWTRMSLYLHQAGHGTGQDYMRGQTAGTNRAKRDILALADEVAQLEGGEAIAGWLRTFVVQ